MNVNTCGLARLLVPAFLAGFIVTSVSGNEPLGWFVAAVTAAGIWLLGRIRGAEASCVIPVPGTVLERQDAIEERTPDCG